MEVRASREDCEGKHVITVKLMLSGVFAANHAELFINNTFYALFSILFRKKRLDKTRMVKKLKRVEIA